MKRAEVSLQLATLDSSQDQRPVLGWGWNAYPANMISGICSSGASGHHHMKFQIIVKAEIATWKLKYRSNESPSQIRGEGCFSKIILNKTPYPSNFEIRCEPFGSEVASQNMAGLLVF
jgi:hypothetical protein